MRWLIIIIIIIQGQEYEGCTRAHSVNGKPWCAIQVNVIITVIVIGFVTFVLQWSPIVINSHHKIISDGQVSAGQVALRWSDCKPG